MDYIDSQIKIIQEQLLDAPKNSKSRIRLEAKLEILNSVQKEIKSVAKAVENQNLTEAISEYRAPKEKVDCSGWHGWECYIPSDPPTLIDPSGNWLIDADSQFLYPVDWFNPIHWVKLIEDLKNIAAPKRPSNGKNLEFMWIPWEKENNWKVNIQHEIDYEGDFRELLGKGNSLGEAVIDAFNVCFLKK